MKQTVFKLPEDLMMRINRMKYQWGCKTQADVIRKLFEICSKIENADTLTPNEVKEGKESDKVGGDC